MKLAKNKKGVIGELQSMIAPLIGVAIVLAVGFLIFAQMKEQVVDVQSSGWCPTGFTYTASSLNCCNVSGFPGSNVTNCIGAANSTAAAFSDAYNGTGTLQNAIDDIPGWIPIIIVAIIGAALLGIVRYFKT